MTQRVEGGHVSGYNICYHVAAILIPFNLICNKTMTAPHSAVGNMFGYRSGLTGDPGVVSLIPTRSHTFVETDHETISKVIRLPSAESFKKGCCQLQAKVCARSTGEPLVQA